MTLPSDPNTHVPPVLHLRLVGRGENAQRMEKRLTCVGRLLGIQVKVAWDSGQYGEPLVYKGNDLLVDHLVSTEELEILLKATIE